MKTISDEKSITAVLSGQDDRIDHPGKALENEIQRYAISSSMLRTDLTACLI